MPSWRARTRAATGNETECSIVPGLGGIRPAGQQAELACIGSRRLPKPKAYLNLQAHAPGPTGEGFSVRVGGPLLAETLAVQRPGCTRANGAASVALDLVRLERELKEAFGLSGSTRGPKEPAPRRGSSSYERGDPRPPLQDILGSTEQTRRYTRGMNRAAFHSNEAVQDAVVRRSEVLVEAVP